MQIPSILSTVSDELQKMHAKAVLVGGSVRDYFLGLPLKDYDVEVYGLKCMDQLEKLLSRYGKVKLVGKSFGVLKFIYEGTEYDFAFPRTERKTGSGHRGFDVSVDGSMAFADAARRRDFTVNAMGYDIAGKRFLDPSCGRRDLERKILRHIDTRTFVEDPLRLYRGVQFCARFGFAMHPSTKKLCRNMVEEGMLEELPKERVFDEIKKLLLQAEKPSSGFVLLKEMGALRYFPYLSDLPEPLWQETLRRLDVTALLKDEKQERALILMLSALVLSLARESQVRELIGWLSNEVKLISSVLSLWKYYRDIMTVSASEDLATEVRKLSVKANISELVLVAKADYLAKKALMKGTFKAGEKVLQRAERLGVAESPPNPLLQGRDLLQAGCTPSPKFKDILDKVYDAQLRGVVKTREEALKFVTQGENDKYGY